MNLTHLHCHSLNSGINALYFSDIQTEQPWGYSFFSKRSKTQQKNCVLFPEKWLDIPGERIQFEHFKGSSSSVEVLYVLSEIDDREKYKNQKAYKSRIKSSLKKIDELGISVSIAKHEDFSEIKRLHDTWVATKMADDRVHKHSFNTNRYIRCVEKGLNRSDTKVLVMRDRSNEIIGCRVVIITDVCAFGAANFIAFWKYSHVSEACNIASLLFLRDAGVSVYNTGIATGSLKKYKQQFPNYVLKIWRCVIKDTPLLLDC